MHETEPSDLVAEARNGAGLDDAPFGFVVADDSGTVVVTLAGELDLAAAPALQRQLLAVFDRPVESLTLDLSGLTFLDSSGLGALYRTRQAAEDAGIPLRLQDVPDHVIRVLDVTAMAQLFEITARPA